jgi:hypothetical protein
MAEFRLSLRRIGIALMCVGAALYCVFALLLPRSKPPEERKLIGNFYAHRGAFERLRDMLMEDQQVRVVASFGVETANSGPHRVEAGGDFQVNRYNEYLSLLRQIGGTRAFRIRKNDSELIGISVWATGWGGDTRHIDVYWTGQPPPDQVASLDEYYRTSKPHRPVFRHIDGDWYLWADW